MRASFVAMRWALPSWGAWSAAAGFPFHVGPIGKVAVGQHRARHGAAQLPEPERAQASVPLLDQEEIGLRHVVGERGRLREAVGVLDQRERAAACVERGAVEHVDVRARVERPGW